MKIDRIDIIKVFSDIAARYQDNEIKTYAHLKYAEEFGDTALNKTKKYLDADNQGIFYSKEWNDISNSLNKTPFGFPSLVSFSNEFGAMNKQIMYTFELYVCEVIAITDNEVWERKVNRIEKLLRSVINEVLLNYVFATTNLDVTGGWYSKNVLAAALLNNDITEYHTTAYMRERIKNGNSLSFKVGYSQTPKDLITVGTSLDILGCYTLDTNFNTSFTL
jgi:hypothetical protein